MENNYRGKCLVISNNIGSTHIYETLGKQYHIIERKSISEALLVLRCKPIDFVILCLSGKSEVPFQCILKLRHQFSNIPLIAVLSDYNLETVRYCGELGIIRVICTSQIDTLIPTIEEIINSKNIHVTLKSFGLNIENYSGLVKEILIVIEKHYILIMSVQEIGDLLDVSEAIFSKEFGKCNLIGPKRWLLYFKVRHALNLMKNKGLQLSEITYLSGFSNERRFNECFHRVLNKSPSFCRDELETINVNEFWDKNFIEVKEAACK